MWLRCDLSFKPACGGAGAFPLLLEESLVPSSGCFKRPILPRGLLKHCTDCWEHVTFLSCLPELKGCGWWHREVTPAGYHFFSCECLQQTGQWSTERLTRWKEALWGGMCGAAVQELISVWELKGWSCSQGNSCCSAGGALGGWWGELVVLPWINEIRAVSQRRAEKDFNTSPASAGKRPQFSSNF